MVRYGGAVGGGRLGGTDVQPPVDLHCVDADQLDVGTVGSQGHGDIALARGGRPDDDQWQGAGHPASTAMRRLCCGSTSNSMNRPTR